VTWGVRVKVGHEAAQGCSARYGLQSHYSITLSLGWTMEAKMSSVSQIHPACYMAVAAMAALASRCTARDVTGGLLAANLAACGLAAGRTCHEAVAVFITRGTDWGRLRSRLGATGTCGICAPETYVTLMAACHASILTTRVCRIRLQTHSDVQFSSYM
jgi:hypothetical protein